MRKLQTGIAPFLAVALLVGCASIQSGNDPVVVNAERTITSSVDTFDSLFKVEQQNHVLLKQSAPVVVTQVNMLRRNAPKWINTAKTMTSAYKNNRTAENKASLNTAISVLSEGLRQAQQYLTQIQGGQ